MKILLLGGTGQLGSELLPRLSMMGTVIAPTHGVLDAQLIGSRFLSQIQPDIIVNTVSFKDVDKAELSENAELVRDLNVELPLSLGLWCKKNGSLLVHYSTDYVFSGFGNPFAESAAVHPCNYYGQSKRQGEDELVEEDCPALILRTAGLYKKGHKNFVSHIANKIVTQEDNVKVVNDQTGCITWAPDLAMATCALLSKIKILNAPKIYHVANTGSASRYDVARELERLFNREKSRMVPIATAELQSKVQRPSNSTLDCSLLQTEQGIRLPDWRWSLRACIGHPVTKVEAW